MEEQLIYIGPNISSLGLIKNQIYLNGIPGAVRASIAEIPEIQELIVPVDELDDARRAVSAKGEHLHHAANILKRKAGVR